MTLLTTEIHGHDRQDAVIIFAADRRISLGDLRDSEQPKIFQIQRLHAGIGYFGLAEIPAVSGKEPMAVWLERFLGNSLARTLRDLACELSAALNASVPVSWRGSEVSGFHLCGFAAQSRPEFWYIRNCDDSPIQNALGIYSVREDFQARDAPGLLPTDVAIYRNGDIRAHVCAWQAIDEAFAGLLTAPDFQVSGTRSEYEQWVKYKMELIAQLYERFCKVSVIGRPVDVFSVVW